MMSLSSCKIGEAAMPGPDLEVGAGDRTPVTNNLSVILTIDGPCQRAVTPQGRVLAQALARAAARVENMGDIGAAAGRCGGQDS